MCTTRFVVILIRRHHLLHHNVSEAKSGCCSCCWWCSLRIYPAGILAICYLLTKIGRTKPKSKQLESNGDGVSASLSVQWCSNYMFNKLCVRCCRTMISGFPSFAASHHPRTLQTNALYYETENSIPYKKLS